MTLRRLTPSEREELNAALLRVGLMPPEWITEGIEKAGGFKSNDMITKAEEWLAKEAVVGILSEQRVSRGRPAARRQLSAMGVHAR